MNARRGAPARGVGSEQFCVGLHQQMAMSPVVFCPRNTILIAMLQVSFKQIGYVCWLVDRLSVACDGGEGYAPRECQLVPQVLHL